MTFFNSKAFKLFIDHFNTVNKIIKILINTQYFYRNENFTDNGLINFGQSIITLLTLNSISLNFFMYLKNFI